MPEIDLETQRHSQQEHSPEQYSDGESEKSFDRRASRIGTPEEDSQSNSGHDSESSLEDEQLQKPEEEDIIKIKIP